MALRKKSSAVENFFTEKANMRDKRVSFSSKLDLINPIIAKSGKISNKELVENIYTALDLDSRRSLLISNKIPEVKTKSKLKPKKKDSDSCRTFTNIDYIDIKDFSDDKPKFEPYKKEVVDTANNNLNRPKSMISNCFKRSQTVDFNHLFKKNKE